MAVRRSQIVAVVVLAAAVIYALAVRIVFTHRHLHVPDGEYAAGLAGEYEIVDRPQLQIPDVFDGEHVAIQDAGDGRMRVINESGRALLLEEGADGSYFSQNFSPSGAWILPGIARNWNEGRVTKSADGLLVEGYMLEKGLMLFFFPFKDVSEWQVELRAVSDPE